MSGSGASAAATAVPTTAPTTTMPPPAVTSAAIVFTAPLPPPPLTAIPTDALNALTAAIYGLQRQVGDLTTRMAAIDGRPTSSAPLFVQYGLPGYGGLPQLLASGPVISELSSAPPIMPSLSAVVPSMPASAPAGAALYGHAHYPRHFPTFTITVPSFSSIVNIPNAPSSAAMHVPPPLPHEPPEAGAAGVPRYL